MTRYILTGHTPFGLPYASCEPYRLMRTPDGHDTYRRGLDGGWVPSQTIPGQLREELLAALAEAQEPAQQPA